MTVSQKSMGSDTVSQKGSKKPIHDSLKVNLVAADLNFARALAGNNKPGRDKALKKLKEWFVKRTKVSPFTLDDFLRLWKGLFYSMWMSDKPLNQEECAEKISQLVHFNTLEATLLFFKAGLITLQNEWNGIDQLRLDKFLLFVRRFLRQALFALKRFKFNQQNIVEFSKVLEETILKTNKCVPTGLFMHFTEIFLEELAKVSDGTLQPGYVVYFIKPFIKKLAYATDDRELNCIRKFIFAYLIKQHDLGLDYQEKYEAWRSLGFPGSIDSIRKVVIDKNEASNGINEIRDVKNKPLDPRAGRVNVDLPQIKFHPKTIAEAISEYKFDKRSTLVSRKILTNLIQNFLTLSKGVYPFAQKRIIPKNIENERIDIRKSAKDLIKFENKLLGRNKNKKRKLPLMEEETINEAPTPNKKMKMETGEQSSNNKKETKSKITKTEKTVEETKVKKSKKNDNFLENVIADKNKKKQKINNNNTKHENTISCRNKAVEKATQKKKKIKNKSKNTSKDVLMIFERNSGTWIVTENDVKQEKIDIFLKDKPKEVKIGKTSPVVTPNKDSKNSDLNKDFKVTKFMKIMLTPYDKKESLKKPVSNNTVSTTSISNSNDDEWEPPAIKMFQNGPPQRFDSLEHFLRHENAARKIKRRSLLKKINDKYNENEANQETDGKSKTTEDYKSPIRDNATPKKVRINVDMNTSQELDEHIVQVLASPQVPFDSSKKPGKPLLKTPSKGSPVNPFYRLRGSSLF